jgi:mannose-P-dolichol utilization defect protein 1
VSKVLSICILVGAFFIRIPQIFCILHARSTRGISDLMYHLENISCIISIAYGQRTHMPFTTYGENYFLLGQNFIILFLIYYFEGRIRAQIGFFTLLWFVLLFDAVPLEILNWIIICVPIPLNIISRIPQILELYREKSPGSVSLLMNIANSGGSLIRIFNIITESFDIYILLGYIVSFSLNSIIVCQLVYYKYVYHNEVFFSSLFEAVTVCRRKKISEPPTDL